MIIRLIECDTCGKLAKLPTGLNVGIAKTMVEKIYHRMVDFASDAYWTSKKEK